MPPSDPCRPDPPQRRLDPSLAGLNGNGRTARVAGSLMMMRCGIEAPELLNVESAIRADTAGYAHVLQSTHGAAYDPDRHSADRMDRVLRGAMRRSSRASQSTGRGARSRRRNADSRARRASFGRTADDPVGCPSCANSSVGNGGGPGAVAGKSPGDRGASGGRGSAPTTWERRGRRYGPGTRLLDLPLRTPGLMDRFRTGEAADEPGGEHA